MKEGAGEFFALAGPDDKLFNELYPVICQERGEAPQGTRKHKENLLHELAQNPLFFRKGERAALRRWFSWHKAMAENRESWHLRLLTLL
eukprot:7942878-Lingulodinium_polyedra.AAC.1